MYRHLRNGLLVLAHTLRLMLPALAPSWRFFDVIAPSPRIQYRLLNDTRETPEWREFKPRPEHVPMRAMFMRLWWNSAWNEQLFMVSCAERILMHYTPHSEEEIQRRIRQQLSASELAAVHHLQFRLLIVERQGQALVTQEAFVSRPFAMATPHGH